MKKGDKFYCIKNYENNMFTTGVSYIVYDIDKDVVYMIANRAKIMIFCLPDCNFSGLLKLNKLNPFSEFSDYFVNIKEYRKLKLEKLEFSNRRSQSIPSKLKLNIW